MTSRPQSSGDGFGKLILLGEHAVVFGHQALVAGLVRKVTLAVAPADDLVIDLPDWGIRRDATPALVASAAGAILRALGWHGAHVTGHADIPSGAGMGSSAAFCVALVKACAGHMNRPLTRDEVIHLASIGETTFHGTASGVDVAAAAYGCLGSFSKTEGFMPLAPMPVQLVVGVSGAPRSTADMVARVRHNVEQGDGMPRVERLGDLAAQGIAAIARGQLHELGAAFYRAHDELAALGVSHPALDGMVAAARDCGALGAKLTGAGGGGSAIALAPGREDIVVRRWQQLGFAAFAVTLGQTP